MPEILDNQNKVVEEEQPETKILNNISYFPEGKHIWRQQGPYVVCQNCVLHHAVHIGIDKIMVGEDDEGKPILRDKASI